MQPELLLPPPALHHWTPSGETICSPPLITHTWLSHFLLCCKLPVVCCAVTLRFSSVTKWDVLCTPPFCYISTQKAQFVSRRLGCDFAAAAPHHSANRRRLSASCCRTNGFTPQSSYKCPNVVGSQNISFRITPSLFPPSLAQLDASPRPP